MSTEPTHIGTTPQLPALPSLPLVVNSTSTTHQPASTDHQSARTRGHLAVQIGARVVVVIAALWLFLIAIAVMKTGARELAPALQGSTLTNSGVSTLGFGWFGAMLVMSGSPIAASALALFDGAALSASQALTMLTGSRLGAAFVVLVVALIYALRGKGTSSGRKAALSIGIFALILTAVVYVPALLIGIPLLKSGVLAPVADATPVQMFDMIDAATTPAVNALHAWAPAGAMFFIGLLLLLVSVRMIDKCLPEASSQTEHLEDHADWRSRPWIMFGVGSAVALITMSVSVALTVLVPVVAKGYFRRRHAIPYILGANIATLGDTLLTSLALGNGVAVQIVLAELISILIVTGLLLSLFYKPLTELLLRVTDSILASRGRLIGFCTALFAIPLSLILFV